VKKHVFTARKHGHGHEIYGTDTNEKKILERVGYSDMVT